MLRQANFSAFWIIVMLGVLAQDDHQYWFTPGGLLMGQYSKSSDSTWVTTSIMGIANSELKLSVPGGPGVSVDFNYQCPGRTVRCTPLEIEYEIHMTFQDTPEKLKEGGLEALDFIADSGAAISIGQPLEWKYSKCWLEGQRDRCTTGTFSASLTRAEFLKIAGAKTSLEAVVPGVGRITIKGWVLERVRA